MRQWMIDTKTRLAKKIDCGNTFKIFCLNRISITMLEACVNKGTIYQFTFNTYDCFNINPVCSGTNADGTENRVQLQESTNNANHGTSLCKDLS